MSGTEPSAHHSPRPDPLSAGFVTSGLRKIGPPLLFGLRLWASVTLALYVSFWLQLDNAYWAGTSAAVVCQPSLGASLRKGWYRLAGTFVGAIFIVQLTAWFPQDRVLFLVGLALWGGCCACVSTLLRNFAAYSAALAGYTAAIIASDQLGATGGPNGAAFTLAILRASEICIGIVCAGIVLAGTDFGSAPRRLAASFASLAAETTRRFVRSLTEAGSNFLNTQTVRRELLRRVIALDPVIDEALGESSQLRYHSPVLQTAVDGLFAALAAWRAVEVHLELLPKDQARREVAIVLSCLPVELQSVPEDATDWIADPISPRRACERAVRRLVASAGHITPSLRLLAAQSAETLTGIARAFEAVALLTDNPATKPIDRRVSADLRIPDWLPSLVNGARAFIAIGIVEIFWIIAAWPNGAFAITFAAITVILFAPRADQAYAAALSFVIGSTLAAAFAAVVAFAVLPRFQTFLGLSLVLGCYLVPTGALMAQSWQKFMFTAMTANFLPLLAPANVEIYDPAQFYNTALALVAGAGVAVLSYRLLPPLSSEFRARRLLASTLRDLRRIAADAVPEELEHWQRKINGRLSAMPDEVTPEERAELMAALFVGVSIIRLRRMGERLDLGGHVRAALDGFAHGDSRATIVQLDKLDKALASRSDARIPVLRMRGLILAISEAVSQHTAYFDEEGAVRHRRD